MSLDFYGFFNKRILNYRVVKYFKWNNFYWFLLGLTVSVGDSKLTIATGIFPLVMFFSYRLNTLSWFNYFFSWIQNLNSSHYRLLKSVILAGFSSLVFYLIVNSSHSFYNLGAIALIFQLLIIIVAISLLENKILFSSKKTKDSELDSYNILIINLTETSCMKRLWAVNNIFNKLNENHFNYTQLEEIREYLMLLIKSENEAIIKQKIEIILREIDDIFAHSFGDNYSLQSNAYQSKYIASSQILSKPISEKTEIKAHEMIPLN